MRQHAAWLLKEISIKKVGKKHTWRARIAIGIALSLGDIAPCLEDVKEYGVLLWNIMKVYQILPRKFIKCSSYGMHQILSQGSVSNTIQRMKEVYQVLFLWNVSSAPAGECIKYFSEGSVANTLYHVLSLRSVTKKYSSQIVSVFIK